MPGPGAAVRAAPPLSFPAPGRPGPAEPRRGAGAGRPLLGPSPAGPRRFLLATPTPPNRTGLAAAAATSARPHLGPRFRSDSPASWFRLGGWAGGRAERPGRGERTRDGQRSADGPAPETKSGRRRAGRRAPGVAATSVRTSGSRSPERSPEAQGLEIASRRRRRRRRSGQVRRPG